MGGVLASVPLLHTTTFCWAMLFHSDTPQTVFSTSFFSCAETLPQHSRGRVVHSDAEYVLFSSSWSVTPGTGDVDEQWVMQ